MIEVKTLGAPRLTSGFDRLRRIDRAGHRAIHGRMPRLTATELIDMAKEVDLRGRGGAAFPVARKMSAVYENCRKRDQPPVVVVNATEGEPGSLKDKMLLTRAPHLVLDGAAVAAAALRAREIIIGVTDWEAERSLLGAINERVHAGRDDQPWSRGAGGTRMIRMPERFVSGESGALVRGINGEEPIPPGQKVLAADRGVAGLPTYFSNAETFAQIAMLASLGPEAYASVGTSSEPGTVLLTVAGNKVLEAPAGIPLSTVLGSCDVGPGQGVLVGGYHGAWITAEAAAKTAVSREGMAAAGGTLGAGIMLPLRSDTCPLGEVAAVAGWLGEESAGQCGPCRLGLPQLALTLSALAAGEPGALGEVRRISGMVRGRGACAHPDGTVRFVLSAIEVFADDVAEHAQKGTCGRPVRGVLPGVNAGARLEVDWSRCDGHGLCGHLIPGMVRLDQHGFPVLTRAAVPEWLMPDARQAVEMCPALALRLQS